MNSVKQFINQAGKWLSRLPWKRIGLISLCSFLALTLLVMIFVTAFAQRMLNQIERPIEDNDDTLPSNLLASIFPTYTLPSGFTGVTIPPEQVTIPDTPELIVQHEALVNIMLVGQDRREGETYRTRSDAMILCTFNKQDKTLTMTSFMRDLYVQIPGWGYNKLNAAYTLGGMSLLGDTILQNFGVKIDAFIEVDFSGFQKAVETLGGVDIKLSAEEAAYMNENYSDKRVEDNWPLKAGVNHLSGPQALYYSRIRYIGMDFERTERQRKVMTALLNSVKNIGVNDALALMNTLLPMIRTDMSNQDITSYLLSLLPVVASGNMQNQRIPADGTYQLTYVGAMDVVLPDYSANRQYLLDTLMPR